MSIGGQREYLDHAVGKFHQHARMVAQSEVLFCGPEALEWLKIDDCAILMTNHVQWRRTKFGRCHDRLLLQWGISMSAAPTCHAGGSALYTSRKRVKLL